MSRDRPHLSNGVTRGDPVAEDHQPTAVQAVSDRDRGDRARDRKAWEEAARCYERHLRSKPRDAAIWVQLGNCLKEAGKFKAALQAYESATELDDTSADVHLQKGHLYKIMGRILDAQEAYLSSFRKTSRNNPAFSELLALNAKVDSFPVLIPSRESQVIYLDITDLIDYLRVNNSLSGIQRVVSNLVLYSDYFAAKQNGCVIKAVLPDYNDLEVYAVSPDLLNGLIGVVAQGDVGGSQLSQAVDAVVKSKYLVDLSARDTLLISGAFWIFQRYDLLNSLRQKGVIVTVFIHDLIQVTDPQFVEPAATTVFRRSVVDTLNVTNYILTNSHFVADEVRRYIAERLNFSIPVIPVTLATELGATYQSENKVFKEYVELAEGEYVLCVGTIEIRKNHIYLIKLWERLIKQLGEDVPNLVFVGKWGWEIQELQDYLSKSDYLGGRLYIYNGISDGDLAYLYKRCLFTIYPSFAEGWGLPVGESLGYGKPCVASKSTAIPEVGGALCRYIDPFSIDDGLEVVSKILMDRPGLAAWEERIKSNFQAKTWQDFSAELFEVVMRSSRDEALSQPGNNCILETGLVAPVGNDALAQLDVKRKLLVTARMCRMSGWHGVEAWGCWAARRRATLRLNTRMAEGTEAIIYLNLKVPEGNDFADCTVKVGKRSTFIDELNTSPQWFTVRGAVLKDGAIDVVLVSGRGFHHRHGRELYVGVVSIAVAPVHDHAARYKLLEQIVPGGAPTEVTSMDRGLERAVDKD